MKLKVKLLNDDAQIPTRSNATDAGYDLYASEDKVIIKGLVTTVHTGIAIAVPPTDYEGDDIRCYARVAPRSGLAIKHGIDTFAGVVDQGYTGEVIVALFNTGIDEYQVKKGDRIAQLIITPILTPPIEVVDELEATERGDGGFGSSGK